MDPSTPELVVVPRSADVAPRPEVRCAVRFPLRLAVVLSAGNQEFAAVTVNVSASGVLFETDRTVEKGITIAFQMRMPSEVLGTHRDVLVHCLGRVVRCYANQSGYHTAATIDEYKFADQ